ncbi:MAG: sterol-binding protein [Pseudonocardiaceae bacterium]|nr:sterol-binding protein [Pseudonocardiaceae bacterium]
MLGEAGTGIEIAALRTETLVWLIERASRAQLGRLMSDPRMRALMLNELFRRMAAHLDREKANSADVVVCWRFPEGSGEGGYDRFQTVIENGECVSGEELDRVPHATVTIAAADLLTVATGSTPVTTMFLLGRIKVKGDIPLVARLPGYFDIPKP